MAQEERRRRWTGRVIDATAGGLAGLAAGLAMAVILSAQGRLDPNPVFLGLEMIGVGTHLGLALVAGCLYGTIYRYQPGGLAAAVGAGLVFGLGWWIVVHLTLVPLVAATGPGWSLAEAAALFPRLVSGVLVAGLTAILFQLVAARLSRDVEPTAIVTSSVPVRQRIVILGGGFGGVAAAQRLEQLHAQRPDVEVTLVSRSNFLLFTPMLAEVASSSLTARHISAPIRAACPRTRFRRADVETIDPLHRTVTIRDRPGGPDEQLPYDQLILALGAVPGFHGLPGVAEHARTLKTLDDAVGLRDHCIRMLERAEAEPSGPERRRLLTFVVAGGGFAGAELIAELGDLVRSALVYYPGIAPHELRFVLVHSRDRILPELSDTLAAYARERMEARGIEFRLGVRLASATADTVTLNDGTEVGARTFVWTAGNEPNPLVTSLDTPRNRAGAVIADETLRVGGLEGVWAVGDCAQIPDPDRPGEACPPTAQHALRQGKLAAENAAAALAGRPARPFRFRTLGMLVVLGHNTAAAEIRGRRFSGLLAWLMWRGIYLAKLPGIEKRVRVLIDWALDLFFPRDIVLSAGDGPRNAAAAPQPVETAGEVVR